MMKNESNHINIAYLSTGSNLGDKLENCRSGLAALSQTEGIHIDAVSAFYMTEPMEYSDQPWFVNAAVRIRTTLDPLDLLTTLKTLEQKSGRKDSGIRFGPRTLDFDIIFYNDIVLDTPSLIVPHPRLHEREFVLRPICDLAPELMHPVLKKTAGELLAALQSDGHQCIKMAETG
jgi:2-amino-4-hydroxy-6-hydroxymethyldihydropteridine diphosphokinase